MTKFIEVEVLNFPTKHCIAVDQIIYFRPGPSDTTDVYLTGIFPDGRGIALALRMSYSDFLKLVTEQPQ